MVLRDENIDIYGPNMRRARITQHYRFSNEDENDRQETRSRRLEVAADLFLVS